MYRTKVYLAKVYLTKAKAYKGGRCIFRGCKECRNMFGEYLDKIIFTSDCLRVFAVVAPRFSVVAQKDFCFRVFFSSTWMLLLLP